MSADLDIRVAAPDDLDAFVALLEEAGAWLWERGIRQWEPGSHDVQRPRLARDLARGCVRLVRLDGQVAAGAILDWVPGPVWKERPGEAGYVSKLAVARAFAGLGLGHALLRDCESATRETGREFVRLDCWSGNERLRAYYAERGYIDCGEAETQSFSVARFEKRVRQALESRADRA